jgi:predicted TIM-barrel fold metal-dependent hydrolase
VICTGICHRFPKLKFVSVESGAGWLLYFMESLDWHWKAYGGTRDRPERELPSYYFRRQIYGSFWFEQESVRLIAENMADNIMFESDFPHPTSLSPGPASPAARPRDMAEAAVKGLPDDVIAKIFYKNAAELYHLDLSAAMPASRP